MNNYYTEVERPYKDWCYYTLSELYARLNYLNRELYDNPTHNQAQEKQMEESIIEIRAEIKNRF